MTEQTKPKQLAFSRGGFIAIFLTAVFVILRATNVIDWNWLWVVSPLWIYAGLIVAGYVIIGIIVVIVYLIVKDKKNE